MLLIFTSSVSTRLRYIAHLLFKEIYGLKTEFTLSEEEYLQYEGPKIAYGQKDPGEGLFVEASGLLFEQTVFLREVPIRMHREIPLLFESVTGHSGFPFDLLAASFYLVSRYEEYTSVKHDKYGRFPASDSIAFRGGFLEKPVVNIWLKLFIERLQQLYPGLTTHQRPYRYLPTIDIDHAYAYKHRPLHRTIGGIGRSLSKGRLPEVVDRFRVLAGIMSDPYDSYVFIRDLHELHHLPTLWFLLFADYGGDDNNIPVRGRGLSRLVKDLSAWSEIGIHPSLSSNTHSSKLKQEIDGLSLLTGKEITRSRQHFLKFSFPSTFLQLGELGITDEFSMGYASHPGFRAGIAHPFRFFNLSGNLVTDLHIHPVPLMDVTFRDYLRADPDESLDRIKQMIKQVRSCNGELVSLWHNESLSGYGRWKGWRRVYEQMVALAAE